MIAAQWEVDTEGEQQSSMGAKEEGAFALGVRG